jgi:holo-[acyl-carrier protein] synthase
MSVIMRTGVDMEDIDRLRNLAPGIRERFICRILTDVERDRPDLSDETITGLFCAKEAAAKALGCGIGEISWQEIEILQNDQRAPMIHLSGRAADLALSQGLQHWTVSISHTRSAAVATVIGYGET